MLESVSGSVQRYIKNTPNGTEIPDSSFRKRHRAILLVSAIFVLVVFWISRMTGAESVTGAELPAIPLAHSVGGVGIIVTCLVIAAVPQFPRRVRSTLVAVGFMSIGSVLAYYTGGFIEAHFLYFIGVGIVSVYEDWAPFAVTVGYVFAQHSVFGLIEWFTVYNHQAAMANPVTWGMIHALGVLMLAGSVTFLWQSLAIQRQRGEKRVQAKLDEANEARELAEKKQQEAAAKTAEIEALNDELEAAASDFQETMAACADGDLTQRLDTSIDHDSMAAVAESFNEMIDDVESTMVDIQSVAERVTDSSTDVASRTADVEDSASRVESSVTTFVDRSDEQNEKLESVAGEVSDLSAAIEEVASSADTVTSTATTAVESSEAGQQYASDATTELDAIRSQSAEVVGEMETLVDRMDEINEIVDLIRDIAEQTNILALNASIEAARADKEGDGFAVVADEVKQLAEEASSATDDIEQRISDARHVTDETMASVERMGEQVETGSETIDEAVAMFDEIATAIEKAESGIAEISGATDDQAASAEEIASMVDSVAESSRATAADAEDVAEQTGSQLSLLAETAADADELTDLADRLADQVSMFTTRRASDAAAAVSADAVAEQRPQADGGSGNPG